MERFVDPYHFDERREVCAKASNGIETETSPDERIRLDENKRRRHEPRSTRTKVAEGALRAGVVLVLRVEQGQQRRRIREGRMHSKASSR